MPATQGGAADIAPRMGGGSRAKMGWCRDVAAGFVDGEVGRWLPGEKATSTLGLGEARWRVEGRRATVVVEGAGKDRQTTVAARVLIGDEGSPVCSGEGVGGGVDEDGFGDVGRCGFIERGRIPAAVAWGGQPVRMDPPTVLVRRRVLMTTRRVCLAHRCRGYMVMMARVGRDADEASPRGCCDDALLRQRGDNPHSLTPAHLFPCWPRSTQRFCCWFAREIGIDDAG